MYTRQNLGWYEENRKAVYSSTQGSKILHNSDVYMSHAIKPHTHNHNLPARCYMHCQWVYTVVGVLLDLTTTEDDPLLHQGCPRGTAPHHAHRTARST